MIDPSSQPTTHDLMREVEAVLVRRVEEVERENDRLKRRGVALMIGTGVALGLSALALAAGLARDSNDHVAGVLQAQKFVLRDSDGMIRGLLENTDNGGARFVLQDRDGRERMKLTLLSDGSPGLTFADREGESRAVLGLLPDETANLVFADQAGRTRAVLGLSADESPTLVFADRNGITRLGMSVGPGGEPDFTLFEREQTGAAPAPIPESPAASDSIPAAQPLPEGTEQP